MMRPLRCARPAMPLSIGGGALFHHYHPPRRRSLYLYAPIPAAAREMGDRASFIRLYSSQPLPSEDPHPSDDPLHSEDPVPPYPELPIPSGTPSHSYILPTTTMSHTDRYRILAELSEDLPAQAVLRIMPEALHALESGDAAFTSSLLRPLLGNVTNKEMTALVKPIVDVLLDRMESFVWSGEITGAGHLNSLYHQILSCIGQVRLRPGTKQERRSATVRQEVARVTTHLIHLLALMPSSSQPKLQPRLSAALITHLLSRPVFTRELYPVLKGYLERHETDLLASQWNRLRMTAALLGDTEAEKLYEAHMKDVLGRSRQENTEREKFRHPDMAFLLGIENVKTKEQQRSLLTGRSAGRLATPDPVTVVARISDDIARRNEDDLGQEAIRFMANAGPHGSLDELYATLSPYLMVGTPLIALHHAWSILLTNVANDIEISAEALLGIAATVPAEAAVARTLTPVMRGLLLRNKAGMAWAVWEELVEKEKGGLQPRGMYVDRVSLGIASQVCHVLYGLDLAVKMVDSWAARPWTPAVMGNQLAHSIGIDVRNLNMLLRMCRSDMNPSVAFRLWSAAPSRWGVNVDSTSLKMILDVARHARANEENPDFLPAVAADIREGWHAAARLLGTAKQEPVHKKSEPFDLAALAEGPTSVLLDPPEFKWNNQFVDRPWEYARRLFLEVVLLNWPHLKDIRSPLTQVDTRLPLLPSAHTLRPGSPFLETFEIPRQLPSLSSRYTSVQPNALAFNAYISLLGYYRMAEEIPVVLAWMKELDVRPMWTTMRLALVFMMESQGPRRWVRGWGDNGRMSLVRDEDIMRKWLEEWLGDGTEELPDGDVRSIVPTSDDVIYWRRMLMETGKKLTV